MGARVRLRESYTRGKNSVAAAAGVEADQLMRD